MSVSLHDSKVRIGLGDLVRDANARLVVSGDADASYVVECVDRPLRAGDCHANAEVRAVNDLAALIGAPVA